MSASARQIQLIDKLQELGASIPCKGGESDAPDFSMLESVEGADLYIKEWLHLLAKSGSEVVKGQYRPGSAISVKQTGLIAKLHDMGAPIPRDDEGEEDRSRFESVAGADAFIKEWLHLFNSNPLTELSAAEWGGIPNH